MQVATEHHPVDQHASKAVGSNHEHDALRAQLQRRAARRHLTTLCIHAGMLAIAFVVATVGVVTGTDLNALLGNWRLGIVVLVGASLLFALTIRLQLALQYDSRVDELERLQRSNTALAERLRRRLERRPESARSV